MFRDKQVIPLFPSNVWVHDLTPEISQPMNERLLRRIDELLDPKPELQPGQTWQTRNDLQEDPEFAELIGYASSAVDGVLEFLSAEPLPFEVTGCWANVNPSGSPHAKHLHPNNYLSSVYFVKTPKGADSITFHDPREYSQFITPKFRKITPHNSLDINVEARTGRLAVFPAWLKHSVPPNQSEGERVSIAINFMFSDFTRTVSRPQWQGIG
jgi:uncharacterized protein (TIGR02466 family)